MPDNKADAHGDLLRGLPSVSELLELEALQGAKADAGHALTADAIREALSEVRETVLAGERAAPPSVVSVMLVSHTPLVT